MPDLSLNLEHVTRVEGHGNVRLDVKSGKIERLDLEIVESPRFYEGMLRGRRWHEAPHITCRICGICSVSHTTASIKALEAALGVRPSRQTLLLRKLILYAEIMQSHILHTYFLALPDFFKAGSVLALAADHKEAVLQALRLKRLANDICAVIGGRHVHPISMAVGGFTHLPEPDDLLALHRRLKEALPDLQATVELWKHMPFPDFAPGSEFLALRHPDEYAFYDGQIGSSVMPDTPAWQYQQRIREFVVPHSHAKHAQTHGSPYTVGALARFNLNWGQLCPEALAAAEAMNLRAPCHNPFMNNLAQVVETVHLLHGSLRLIEQVLAAGLKPQPVDVTVRAGEGVGAVEVPRGTLYHHYLLDHEGVITAANLIIPTAQNLDNIEAHLRALVPTILDRPKEDIALNMEMLVRAYDPCISCATHLLEVEFVE